MVNHHSTTRLLVAAIAVPLLLLPSFGRTSPDPETRAHPANDLATLVATAKGHPAVQVALGALGGSGLQLSWDQVTTVSVEELVGLQVPVDGVAALLSLTFRDQTLLDASLMLMRADGFPVCHDTGENGDGSDTLVLTYSALSEHLSHGDEMFPCPGDPEFAGLEIVAVSLAFGELGVFEVNDDGELEVTAMGTWAGTATLEELTTVTPISEDNAPTPTSP